MRRPRITPEMSRAAGDAWGFNCGPGALCGLLDMTPDEIRPSLLDFEARGYTNPSMMFGFLGRLDRRYSVPYRSNDQVRQMPPIKHGVVRIQWGGGWTRPEVNPRVAYTYTHWVAVCEEGTLVFDINLVGTYPGNGWVTAKDWDLNFATPVLARLRGSNGKWWATHGIEVEDR